MVSFPTRSADAALMFLITRGSLGFWFPNVSLFFSQVSRSIVVVVESTTL